MPDSVKIGIEAVDNTAAGIASATSNLQKLNSVTGQFGTTTTNARAIMEGWTKSQYAAAVAGDALTTKALQLEKAVNSGKMTVQQATSAYKAFEQQQKANIWQAMTFGEKYRVVSANVNDSVKTIGSAAVKFGAMAAGVGYATKQVYDFGKAGAEIEYTRQKFDRLAVSVGTTGAVFMTDLRAATQGTVSDFGLLKMGSDLLQLGLAADAKEATRLSRVMTALGMDTGELTLALANQSKRRLDQLGLSLSKFNEIESKLKGTGLTKEQAFKEAFLQTAEQTVLLTGNRANSAMAPYLQMQAGWGNLVDQGKIATANAIGGDVQNFANFFKAMNAVQRGDMEWTGNLWQMLTTNGPVLRPRDYFEQAKGIQYRGMAADYSLRGGRGREMIRRAEDYSQLANYYGRQAGGGTTAAAAEVEPPDYAALLSGGMQITKVTEQYTEKTAELNEKLLEENETLAELTKRYGENSEKVADQQKKIDDLKGGVTELNKSYSEAMKGMGMSTLEAKGATEEQRLEFARASGMITQDAYETQIGLNKVAEAFTSGQISAAGYANAVQNVTKWAGTMSEQQFNTYIDVWIRVHGNASLLDNIKGTGGGPGVVIGGHGGHTDRAAGGPLGAGLTVVGEGPTGWSPTAEVIADGYVYNHAQAQTMKDAGLLDGATRHWVEGPLEHTPGIPYSKLPRPSAGRPSFKGGTGGLRANSSAIGGELMAMAMDAAIAVQSATGDGQEEAVRVAVAAAQAQAQIASQTETNKLLKQLIAIQSGQAHDIGRSVAEANVTYK